MSNSWQIGATYLRYFPEQVYQAPSSLTISRSAFKNAENHQDSTEHVQSTFFSKQIKLYRMRYQVSPVCEC